MSVTILQTPLKVSLSGNSVPVKLSTDLTGAEKTFLTIHLKVQKWDGSAWVDVGHDSKLVDSNNEAQFYIQDYLKLQTDPNFEFPEENILISRPGMIFNYRIAYYESYFDTNTNSLVETAEVQSSTDYYSLDGGIDKQTEALYNENGTDWLTELTDQKQFLTWQPIEKKVHQYHTDKLYWLTQSAGTIQLKVKKTLTDATTSEKIAATISASAYTIIECGVSPVQLYSDLTDVDNLQVWLLDGLDNIISEVRTYKLDATYYERNDTFGVLNSFGVFDFIWARGNMTEQVEFNRQTFRRSLSYDHLQKNRSGDATRAMKSNSGTSETGYINEAEPMLWKEYYAEEFLGGKYHVKLDDFDRIYPVVLSTEESLLEKDKQYVYSQQFKWKRTHSNRFFSRHGKAFATYTYITEKDGTPILTENGQYIFAKK